MPSLVGSEMCIRDRITTELQIHSDGGTRSENITTADPVRDGNDVCQMPQKSRMIEKKTEEGGTHGLYYNHPGEKYLPFYYIYYSIDEKMIWLCIHPVGYLARSLINELAKIGGLFLSQLLVFLRLSLLLLLLLLLRV